MKMFFSLFLIFFSFFMFFINHPLSMGLMILIQTLITCIFIGMLIKTYWFSYILFLTFLGGLLVLFIYMSSIASNELFNISSKMKLTIYLFFFLNFIFSWLFFYNLNWMNFINTSDMINFFNNNMHFDYKINLSKLYNTQTYMMMMMLIIYLLITLIAVVKITNIFFGPLRKMSN